MGVCGHELQNQVAALRGSEVEEGNLVLALEVELALAVPGEGERRSLVSKGPEPGEQPVVDAAHREAVRADGVRLAAQHLRRDEAGGPTRNSTPGALAASGEDPGHPEVHDLQLCVALLVLEDQIRWLQVQVDHTSGVDVLQPRENL